MSSQLGVLLEPPESSPRKDDKLCPTFAQPFQFPDGSLIILRTTPVFAIPFEKRYCAMGSSNFPSEFLSDYYDWLIRSNGRRNVLCCQMEQVFRLPVGITLPKPRGIVVLTATPLLASNGLDSMR